MVLWELTPPIFLGAFLAVVALMLLTGTHGQLARGPRRLSAWLFGCPVHGGPCRCHDRHHHGRKKRYAFRGRP
jgi:hypothetical protein